jgi:hypothetical protein
MTNTHAGKELGRHLHIPGEEVASTGDDGTGAGDRLQDSQRACVGLAALVQRHRRLYGVALAREPAR